MSTLIKRSCGIVAAMDEAACSDTRDGAAQECCPAPEEASVLRLALIAKALSDPIRLQMLDLMAQGRSCCGLPDPVGRGVPGAEGPLGICVCEFQEHFGIGQSKVSYHLRVLKEAGLVSEETRGKWNFYFVHRDVAADALESLRSILRV
jgi:ArsR family transcriptional regulator